MVENISIKLKTQWMNKLDCIHTFGEKNIARLSEGGGKISIELETQWITELDSTHLFRENNNGDTE